MDAYVIDGAGKTTKLPVLLSYAVKHTRGEPCDALELECPVGSGVASALESASYVRCEHGGEVVFYGVADEYVLTLAASGYTAELSARGMAARLLDSESEAMEYDAATLEAILQNHVYPFGVTDVEHDGIPAVRGYRVASGQSQWAALRDFTLYGAGVTPRFSRDGRLLIKNSYGGRSLVVGGTSPLISAAYTNRRYGIISEVIVKDASTGLREVVTNDGFAALGGMARRVVNVSRRTDYRSARYTGQYQINKSLEGKRELVIELAALFAAAPGDSLSFEREGFDIKGSFIVDETLCRYGESGYGTRITLVEEE